MNDSIKYLIIGLLLGLALMFLIGGSGSTPGRYEFHTVRKYTTGYKMGETYLAEEYFYILDSISGIAKRYSVTWDRADFNKTK